jgi:hypothetical protein
MDRRPDTLVRSNIQIFMDVGIPNSLFPFHIAADKNVHAPAVPPALPGNTMGCVVPMPARNRKKDLQKLARNRQT